MTPPTTNIGPKERRPVGRGRLQPPAFQHHGHEAGNSLPKPASRISLDALPPGVTANLAGQLAAALDKLILEEADGQARYLTARHVLWQTIATMIAKGMEDEDALQTIVSATVELLTRAAGPAGAAAHLRLMADKVATLQGD